uniref:Homeobox B8 n=1 Tax=Equus caballus TaxID=9796 RepID=A0A3Q2LL86_HORSE
MSSLYYANALFSKYPAASSVFATGAFPEQTSCAFASNPQRPGYGAGSGASFAASMQGLYPGGGGMAGQSAAGVYAAGYGLEPSSFNMHCAPFEQNLSGVCPGDSAKAAGAKEQRDSDLAAETNFRIYPWMRSSGNAAHLTVSRAAVAPGTFPERRPLLGQVSLSASRVLPAGARPWGRGTPWAATRRAAPTPPPFLLGALRLPLLPRRISLRRRRGAPSPQPAPYPSSRPFSFKYLSTAPARAGDEAVCLSEEGWGLQRIAIRVSPSLLPSPAGDLSSGCVPQP